MEKKFFRKSWSILHNCTLTQSTADTDDGDGGDGGVVGDVFRL
jgi:hypothetical protein